MASVHEIGIGAETRGFDEQFKSGVIKPVENAVDAFKDLEKAASDTGKDGARALDKLEDSLKDVQRQSERTERAVDDIGTGGSQSFSRVREGAKEVTQEVGQNLGEAVSSIRGDMSDLGQVGQDTLGGLAATVASMGPAGLVGAFALAAGAVGLGALTAGMEEAKEKQEEVNATAARFAQGYIEGINGAISAASVFGEINSIATDPERYKQAREAATEWGVDVSVAMGAMAGDANALGVAQQALADRSAEASRRLAEQEVQVDQNAGAVYDLADSVAAGKDRMDGLTEALKLGHEQADSSAAAYYNYVTAVGHATDRTDDLGNKIYELPAGKEIVVDANTQRAYEDIDALEKRDIADKELAVRVRDEATAEFERIKARLSNQIITLALKPTQIFANQRG
jgi:uncharacterized protein YoxC